MTSCGDAVARACPQEQLTSSCSPPKLHQSRQDATPRTRPASQGQWLPLRQPGHLLFVAQILSCIVVPKHTQPLQVVRISGEAFDLIGGSGLPWRVSFQDPRWATHVHSDTQFEALGCGARQAWTAALCGPTPPARGEAIGKRSSARLPCAQPRLPMRLPVPSISRRGLISVQGTWFVLVAIIEQPRGQRHRGLHPKSGQR
jgi:hypothetical protein